MPDGRRHGGFIPRGFAYNPGGQPLDFDHIPSFMAKKRIYRIVFHNQGKIYELYAHHVSHGEMYGFVEVSDIIFGERTAILVDPSDEKLKSEFSGVKRTFVPLHAVVRIDEVEKEGAAKIVAVDGDGPSNVAAFPMPMFTPGGEGGPKP